MKEVQYLRYSSQRSHTNIYGVSNVEGGGLLISSSKQLSIFGGKDGRCNLVNLQLNGFPPNGEIISVHCAPSIPTKDEGSTSPV